MPQVPEVSDEEEKKDSESIHSNEPRSEEEGEANGSDLAFIDDDAFQPSQQQIQLSQQANSHKNLLRTLFSFFL